MTPAPNSTPSGPECPVCTVEYAEVVVLEKPIGWKDVYGGRPVEFFEKYHRRCTAKVDVENDREYPRGVVLYFHESARPHRQVI